MILMLAGFLAGWRWEAAGGLLALIGFAVFAAVEVVVNRKPPGGAIPLFVVPGAGGAVSVELWGGEGGEETGKCVNSRDVL